MKDQNLVKIVEKIGLYLDQEMNENTKREFLSEIHANPTYLDLLSREELFRKFIKSNIQRKNPSKELIQSIRNKIVIQSPSPAEV